MDVEQLRAWVGREELRRDLITAAPLATMAATLEHPATSFAAGDEVPPLWHWCYFMTTPKLSELAADGHPRKGGFLPPIPLPRRMWAGSRIEFIAPLRVGDQAERRSTIEDVTLKDGRTGPLAFVRVRHEIGNAAGASIVERQDIVYRDASATPPIATPTKPETRRAHFSRQVQPSTPLLFRYSALTFNSHRIHYDRTYAMQEEGYAGLVVHGPLTATLILDLLQRERPAARIAQFSFRAMSPLLDIHPFTVCGTVDDDHAVSLWAQADDGRLAMNASARLA